MLNKKFLKTDIGKKHVIAYGLHVNYHVYYKDIAKYYGCSSTTIGYWIRNLKKYSHLEDFVCIVESYDSDMKMILNNIQNME